MTPQDVLRDAVARLDAGLGVDMAQVIEDYEKALDEEAKNEPDQE